MSDEIKSTCSIINYCYLPTQPVDIELYSQQCII